MNKEDDFNYDLLLTYSEKEVEYITELVRSCLEDEKELDSEFGWTSTLTKEKHDALNVSYHISLYRESDDHQVDVTFYTGIDVGCEMEHYSLDGDSIINRPNMVSVLVDLKLDFSMMDDGVCPKKAQLMLDSAKQDIMDIYQKQNYDNYVTGGGTCKTDKAYRNEFEKYHERGLFWACVYEEQEFDRNIL